MISNKFLDLKNESARLSELLKSKDSEIEVEKKKSKKLQRVKNIIALFCIAGSILAAAFWLIK